MAKREKAALGSKDTSTTGARLTIFRHLVNSDLPPSELTDERLSREAQVLIGSGTITTAGTLGFICYLHNGKSGYQEASSRRAEGCHEGLPAEETDLGPT